MPTQKPLFALIGLVASAVPAAAQSDPSAFDTVYNVGTVPPGSPYDFPGAIAGLPAGGVLGSDSQLNLFTAGALPGGFEAGPTDFSGTNVELNVFGGSVGNIFYASAGSVVNINGGSVGDSFGASGSEVNITGGSVGSGLSAFSGSEVNITGGSVGSGLDAYSGSEVNITGGSVGSGLGAHSGSVVNISGGSVGYFFYAWNDSVVNITGGSVGERFHANGGSVVNLSGGSVGDHFYANAGSVVNLSGGSVGESYLAVRDSETNISGGSVGDSYNATAGSYTNLIGSAFNVPGGPSVAVGEAAVVTTRGGTLLTGTLLDSSAIALNLNAGSVAGEDRFASDAMLGLIGAPDPTGFDTVLYSPILRDGVDRLTSIGSDTQLNLYVDDTLRSGFSAGASNGSSTNVEVNIFGGSVDHGFQANSGSVVNIFGGVVEVGFQARSGSEVNISGGSVDNLFEAFSGSEVSISGGSIGSGFNAKTGSVVNISGGSVGGIFDAYTGSEVNISGGSVGSGFYANTGSEVNISGGSVGSGFDANTGSMVNISGGSVGAGFEAESGSAVTLLGGVFQLNGSATSDLSAGFGVSPAADFLTGVLADGTVFLFAAEVSDYFAPGTTTLQTAAVAPSANPGVLSSGTFTKGVRSGETLTVNGDGVLGDNFAVVGGTLNIDGGAVGERLEVAFGEVNISGGAVGDRLYAFSGSTVNVSGGEVDTFFRAFSGSTVNLSGGSVGDFFDANSGSVVNITGGSVGDFFDANTGSEVNITGGEIGDGFDARTDSVVNLFGAAFFLDGELLTGLELGETVTITERDVTLTGLLADGSAFDFDLSSSFVGFEDFFDAGATLTVTLVIPDVLPGDYNDDGVVDAADYTVWRDNLSAAAGALPNDTDGGVIGLAQYDTWAANYGLALPTPARAVPEPSSILLSGLMILSLLRRFGHGLSSVG